MILDEKYVYLFYSLLFIALWVVLFVWRRDLRLPMLLMSVLIAPLGPASEAYYLRDYWKPTTITGTPVGIEDLIFSFAIGGIALALYPSTMRRSLIKTAASKPNPFIVLIFAVILGISLSVGSSILKINSVLSSVAAFLLTALFIVILRRDLFAVALISGFLTLVLFVGIYQIMLAVYPSLLATWCTGCNPSGVVILGINLEEYLWDASWGMIGGILYPSIAGYSIQ